ncbi:MAG: hypothetical protein LBC53_02980 [Spirochaetaceae bacterium]|jgi:hypothetical protein|nr:hypothetical protein [Spirochaetaceae bacterium]
MLKKNICIIFLFVFLSAFLPAQEQEEEVEDDANKKAPAWSKSYAAPYTKGDQTFSISVGLLLPMFMVNNDGTVISGYGPQADDMHINIGGTGSLSYVHFITPSFFLGGELQGSFSGTLAEKLLYFIPIGIKSGYQFVAGRFEFPLSVLIGMATHKYSVSGDPAYWGFFVRPQASLFFRFNNDWSFGINAGWWWTPEWTDEPKKNVDGHFLDIMLAARYHF